MINVLPGFSHGIRKNKVSLEWYVVSILEYSFSSNSTKHWNKGIILLITNFMFV